MLKKFLQFTYDSIFAFMNKWLLFLFLNFIFSINYSFAYVAKKNYHHSSTTKTETYNFKNSKKSTKIIDDFLLDIIDDSENEINDDQSYVRKFLINSFNCFNSINSTIISKRNLKYLKGYFYSTPLFILIQSLRI